MLSSISWQQYTAAIALITLGYYLYIISRYYRSEVVKLFTRHQDAAAVLYNNPQPQFEVLGKARQEEHVSVHEEQELVFAAAEPDEPESLSPDEDIIPPLTVEEELLIEVHKLVASFKQTDDKAEFLHLLNTLLKSYAGLSDEIDTTSISQHILSKAAELPFSISSSDLETLNA